MLHTYRSQTMPLGRALRPFPVPSPEGINLVPQAMDLSNGVPYQYHEAGQQIAAFVGRKPVSPLRAAVL